MKNLRIPMVIRVFALVGLLPVLAADLKTFREAYQKNKDETLQSANPKFDELQQQYKKALETLKTVVQNQGDLIKTKAVIAEIDRFQKEKSQPSTLNESELPEIKTYQLAYVKQYNKMEMDLTLKLGALTVKYEQDLDRLQKELVKAGKLDEATAVQAERDQQKTAIKGYADQLAALRDSAATNETRVTSATALSARSALGSGRVSATKQDLYLVVDLKGGADAKEYPVCYLTSEPKGGWTDEYKTDKLVLRKIEPGKFSMGSLENEEGHGKYEQQHQVTLSKAFYIGIFEVTQRQWELVMGSNPSNFKDSTGLCPVEKVSYFDIRENPANSDDPSVDWPKNSTVTAESFMGKLRSKTRISTFDLPTEAQWEYCCRAGTTDAHSGKGGLDNQGWYKDNASGKTHPVGQKEANAWGLYDMHGNVCEWCLDWPGNDTGKVTDPLGMSSWSHRVLRGGNWSNYANLCRSASRSIDYPYRRNNIIGFRAARTLR